MEDALFGASDSESGEADAPREGLGRIVRASVHGGWGVVADVAVAAGEVIVREDALLKVVAVASYGGSRRPSQKLAFRLAALDDASRLRLRDVYPRRCDDAPAAVGRRARATARRTLEAGGRAPTEGAVEELARLLAVVDLSSYARGLWVDLSFFNHATDANCQLRVAGGVATAFSTRAVDAGAPLTLNYLGDRETAHRGELAALGDAHGFRAAPPSVAGHATFGDGDDGDADAEGRARAVDALVERLDALEDGAAASASTAVFRAVRAEAAAFAGRLGEKHVLWRRMDEIAAAAAARRRPDDDGAYGWEQDALPPRERRAAAAYAAASAALARVDACDWLGATHPAAGAAAGAAAAALRDLAAARSRDATAFRAPPAGADAEPALQRRADAIALLYAPATTQGHFVALRRPAVLEASPA